jgi:hypothetical protein
MVFCFEISYDVPEVRISDFLKKHVSIATTRAVLGSHILQVNPGLSDAFWNYEHFGELLSFGLLGFLNRRALNAKERFRLMSREWFEVADPEFDWEHFASTIQPGQMSFIDAKTNGSKCLQCVRKVGRQMPACVRCASISF